MKNKIIKFTSSSPEIQLPHPTPTSRMVPEWFRKLPGAADKVETVKKCVPFLDALTSGYVITLPVDVHFDNENNRFTYDSPFEINSDHIKSQTQGVDVGPEFDDQPHKWINKWKIETPKGYSCLFIHPLNRLDLPFRSFTGIVDTDRHPLVINFPFVMKKDFYGVIPAGTPIIQIIPFKRDNWISKIIDNKPFKPHPEAHEVENPPFSWYKRKWWSRKIYS
jgi:hypothetical protein